MFVDARLNAEMSLVSEADHDHDDNADNGGNADDGEICFMPDDVDAERTK